MTGCNLYEILGMTEASGLISIDPLCGSGGPGSVGWSLPYTTVDVVKLNVDENPNTAQKFGIRSIPTLILIKDGAVQAQMMGAMPKSQLEEFLDTNL